MDIKKMSKEELELLSYTDITYYLLKNKKKPQTTAELFMEITKLLELPESAFEEKIGDYYTSLTTDKRFIILKNGKWDLRTNHTSDKFIVVIDDEEEEEEISTDEDEEIIDEDEEIIDDYPEEEEEDLIGDDDMMDDLSIVDENFDA